MRTWLVFLFLAANCFGQVGHRKITLPSGETGYSIRCDNQSMTVCYEVAGDVCFRGYEIEAESKEEGFEGSSAAYVVPGIAGEAGSASRSTSKKGMLIRCKDPVGTEAERQVRMQRERERRAELEAEREASNARQSKFLAAASLVVVFLFATVAVLGAKS